MEILTRKEGVGAAIWLQVDFRSAFIVQTKGSFTRQISSGSGQIPKAKSILGIRSLFRLKDF